MTQIISFTQKQQFVAIMNTDLTNIQNLVQINRSLLQVDPEFLAKVQEITSKNPFEMTVEEASYLERGTQRTFEQCQVIVHNGGITIFLQLLEHSDLIFIQEGLFGLGNIAHYSTEFRKQIILANGFQRLLLVTKKLQKQPASFDVSIWVMNNICLDRQIDCEYMKEALRYFCSLIVSRKINNDEILKNSLCCITHPGRTNLTAVLLKAHIILQTNLIPSLLKLINHHATPIAKAAVSILSDLSSGTYTRYLLDNDVINLTYPVLFHQNQYIRQNICLIYSNIAADRSLQTSHLLENQRTIQALLMLFKNDSYKVAVQISYIFTNLFFRNTQKSVAQNFFKRQKICLYYAELLMKCQMENKLKSLNGALISFQRLLEASQKTYLKGSINIKECLFGFDLEKILTDFVCLPSQQVRKKSREILQRFF